jgi:hypothetical protein
MKSKLLLILYFIPLLLVAQNEIEYLKKNKVVLTEDKISEIIEYDNYDFYVAGETHYHPDNIYLKYNLFKELYYDADVRYFIIEHGYAEGYLATKYLESGDKLFLNMIASQNRKLYPKLREFYQLLPDSSKFSIIGIDSEDNGYTTGVAFSELFKDYDLINKGIPEVDTFMEQDIFKEIPTDHKNTSLIVNPICKRYKQDPKYFEDKLGEEGSYHFKKMVEAFDKWLEFQFYRFKVKADTAIHSPREQFMAKNIISISSIDKKAKMFGMLGNFHETINGTNLEYLKGFKTCVARVNLMDSSPFKGKVCSFNTIYINKVLPMEGQKDIGIKKKTIRRMVVKRTVSIFNLQSSSSPFTDVAENNYQYLIISRL